jgi:hypothetical protein
MRYSDFAARVRRFRSGSVVELCAYVSWDIWAHGLAGADQQDVALLRAFGGRMAVIAATKDGNAGDEPRGGDLFRLAHGFLEVDEGHSTTSSRRRSVAGYSNAGAFGSLSQYELGDDCLRSATLARTMGRMMRAQWDLTQPHSHALPRAWGAGKAGSAARRRSIRLDTSSALRMEPQVFLRAAYLLFAMNVQRRGRLDLANAPLEDGIRERWDIDEEDLLFVAERLSLHADDLRRWELEVVSPLPMRTESTRRVRSHSSMIQNREEPAAPVALRAVCDPVSRQRATRDAERLSPHTT